MVAKRLACPTADRVRRGQRGTPHRSGSSGLRQRGQKFQRPRSDRPGLRWNVFSPEGTKDGGGVEIVAEVRHQIVVIERELFGLVQRFEVVSQWFSVLEVGPALPRQSARASRYESGEGRTRQECVRSSNVDPPELGIAIGQGVFRPKAARAVNRRTPTLVTPSTYGLDKFERKHYQSWHQLPIHTTASCSMCSGGRGGFLNYLWGTF